MFYVYQHSDIYSVETNRQHIVYVPPARHLQRIQSVVYACNLMSGTRSLIIVYNCYDMHIYIIELLEIGTNYVVL